MPHLTVPADPTTYREPMTSTPRPQNLPQHSVRACAELVGATVAGGAAAGAEALERTVTGISHDSQGIRPGDL
ncbi:MAG TPA: hypothetical protein VGL02_11485, partial [Streptomyces sp.]